MELIETLKQLNLKLISGAPLSDRNAKQIAQSIFSMLKNEGCRSREMIEISNQILGLVVHEMQKEKDALNNN